MHSSYKGCIFESRTWIYVQITLPRRALPGHVILYRQDCFQKGLEVRMRPSAKERKERHIPIQHLPHLFYLSRVQRRRRRWTGDGGIRPRSRRNRLANSLQRFDGDIVEFLRLCRMSAKYKSRTPTGRSHQTDTVDLHQRYGEHAADTQRVLCDLNDEARS